MFHMFNKEITVSDILRKVFCIVFIFLFGSYPVTAQQENIPVHDPSAIKEKNVYHIFNTGFGISHWYSADRDHWVRGKPVFSGAPAWAKTVVPDFKNHIWAPDISEYNGEFYLFYSVSSFGKNTSAIGVATNKTLDESSVDYKWNDHGIVIESVPGRDMWNAIDPNLIVDENGDPWLDFGSFWDGIKLVRLDRNRRSIADPQEWYTIASRKRTFGIADTLAGDAAIEAPFIYRHNGYYYLFVSYDYCCRGIRSNYKIMVGRSERIMGPYRDKEGKLMTDGGATLLLEGNKNWLGLGHNGVLKDGKKEYLVFHAYDANDEGRSKLKILPVVWVEDWPTVGPLE